MSRVIIGTTGLPVGFHTRRDKTKRKKYFIHPSIQIKYILMSIIPALIMSLLCIYFLIKSGEIRLKVQKERLLIELSTLETGIKRLEKAETHAQKVEGIRKIITNLSSLQNILEKRTYILLDGWKQTKNAIILVLLLVGITVDIIALLLSHRIVGHIFRMKQYIDMLSEGKEIPPVRIRKNDEFKEVAESLEKLRKRLAEKSNQR